MYFVYQLMKFSPTDADAEDLRIHWRNVKNICEDMDRTIAMTNEEIFALPPSPTSISVNHGPAAVPAEDEGDNQSQEEFHHRPSPISKEGRR